MTELIDRNLILGRGLAMDCAGQDLPELDGVSQLAESTGSEGAVSDPLTKKPAEAGKPEDGLPATASPQVLEMRLRTGPSFMVVTEFSRWLEELGGALGAAHRFASGEIRLKLRLAHQRPPDANSHPHGRSSWVSGEGRANSRTHDELLSVDCVKARNELGKVIGSRQPKAAGVSPGAFRIVEPKQFTAALVGHG